MLKADVRSFNNDSSLETRLNAFLEEWSKSRPNHRIVSVTSHLAGSGDCSAPNAYHVIYTFFYIDETPKV